MSAGQNWTQTATAGERARASERMTERKRESETEAAARSAWSVQWPSHLQHNCRASLSLSLWCARDTPRCRPLATLVIVAAAVLNFVVFHAHQTSSDNCCIYLDAVFLSFSPSSSSSAPPASPVGCLVRSLLVCGLVRFAHLRAARFG